MRMMMMMMMTHGLVFHVAMQDSLLSGCSDGCSKLLHTDCSTHNTSVSFTTEQQKDSDTDNTGTNAHQQ